MIFVRRDAAMIPQRILDVATRAQAELEGKNDADRKAFIKKKSHIWRAFGRYLREMSYGKCWYSESPDPQSFFDVDHFRPKAEAKRSETEVDSPGYEWLAFSWDNFRYAANCSNRLSENLETGAVDGKGSWFPLLGGSVKASWGNRCEANERPVLLDPIKQADVNLVTVESDGRIGPSVIAIGSAKNRVKRSCELYGLNLPGIKQARQRVMRDVAKMVEVLYEMAAATCADGTPDAAADMLPIEQQTNQIRERTSPRSPYSRAARAALIRAGFAELCANPEEEALAVA
jgi:hypothetical protein